MIVSLMGTVAAHAQFYTIGHTEGRTTQTKNPPMPIEAQEDSVQETDSMASPPKDVMEGKENLGGGDVCVSLPLRKIQINSKFGMRMHPIYHRYIMHNGVDLHARHEDVLSMLPGTVLRVGYDNRSGKYVTVKTANYTVSYCHLSEQYVKPNDFLFAGEPLGLTGNTGASTGEHLHLTTKKDGKAFDPTILLDYIRSVNESSLEDLTF